MPLCLLRKPVGEELEWRRTFLFSPLFISFQRGLCVYVWIHWDACELSAFRNGCSFIQMSCYKTISPAPFCLISFCVNPFILDPDTRLSVAAARFSSRLHGTVTVFSLCAPSLLFPSHSAFLFDVLSLLTAGPGRYTCLILSWATTWPRQCCSSNCRCGHFVFLPGSYTDRFWHPVCFPCFVLFCFKFVSNSEVVTWLL